MASLAPSSSGAAPLPARADAYRWYVAGLLALGYAFNFADRQILGILAPAIKAEMRLSDFELGLLTGPAVAFLYAILSVPMGFAADRVNRVRFLSVCLVVWSALTASGAFAATAVQLALSRLGVSAAESGGTPASSSIIADYFEAERRPLAMGVYGAASTAGLVLCFALGGWISHLYGWRVALLGAGAPGVVLAILILVTVREPQRGRSDGIVAQRQGVWRTFRTLWSSRLYCGALMGGACVSAVAFTISTWVPSMIMRTYHLDAGRVGPVLGLGIGLIGGAAIVIGGVVARRLARRGLRRAVTFCSGLGLVAAPLFVLALFVRDYRLAIVLVSLTYGAMHLSVATQYAVFQAPGAGIRGAASAFPVLFGAMLGLGLMPPLIGAVSDQLKPAFGASALRDALLLVPVLCLVSTVLFRWGASGPRERVGEGG